MPGVGDSIAVDQDGVVLMGFAAGDVDYGDVGDRDRTLLGTARASRRGQQ
jgi:hypothetical protein